MIAVRRVLSKMELDWKISVPTVLAAVMSAVVSGTIAYSAIRSDIRDSDTHMRFLEDRVSKIETDARKVSKIETDIDWIRKLLDQRRGEIENLLGSSKKAAL